MNPEMPLKHRRGKFDGKHVHRYRNLRKVSSDLDPDALDGLASREAMRAKGAGWTTDFGCPTRPLVKFLERRLGRKWDKVYSEVSHAFGMEGRELVRREVLTHTCLDEAGRVVVNDTPWCGLRLDQILGRHLYVDPRGGILRASGKIVGRCRTRRLPTAIVRGDRAYFIRNGLWFETKPATFRQLVERLREEVGGNKEVWDRAYLLLARHQRRLPTLWTREKGEFYCDPDCTRQLSRRRVVQLGLNADEVEATG